MAVSSYEQRDREVRELVREWRAAGASVTRRGHVVELLKPSHCSGKLFVAIDARVHPWINSLIG